MKSLNFGMLWFLFFGSSIGFFLLIVDNFPYEFIWDAARNYFPNEVGEETEDAIFMGYACTATLLINAVFIFLTLTISQKTSRLRIGMTPKKIATLWTVFALTLIAFIFIIHDCIPRAWLGTPPPDPDNPLIDPDEYYRSIDTAFFMSLVVNSIFMLITLHIANRLRSSRLKKCASSADAHH